MKGVHPLCLLVLLGIGAGNCVFAQPNESRVETLETGDQVRVPVGMSIIPGIPLVVTEKDILRIESAKRELESFGYVDLPEESPIAQGALRFARANIGQNRRWGPNVFRVQDFDFSTIAVGRVDQEISSLSTEAFLILDENQVIRVYSNTRFGDVFINEMIGASLSTMGNGGVPNLMVAGLPAYRTVVRYDSEKYATLVLSPSSRGVILLEIGTRFSELDPDLDRILHTLTAELQ